MKRFRVDEFYCGFRVYEDGYLVATFYNVPKVDAHGRAQRFVTAEMNSEEGGE